jgi:hypothetical protein
MTKPITKQDVLKWLKEKKMKCQGQYMEAEEKEDNDAMSRADDENYKIEEAENLITELN